MKEQEIALNNVKKQLDKIYDIVDNTSSSFIEIFGKMGGSRVVFRVYSDGKVIKR